MWSCGLIYPSVAINFFSEDIDFLPPNRSLLEKWITFTVSQEQAICGELNLIFTSDKYLLSINKEYLQHNYYTDIITFNYNEGKTINGDIFISIDTVENNSRLYSVSFNEELHRVIIHGVLHLLAYDDKSAEEKEQMREKENEYLVHLKNLS